ncbi:Patatin-like phospholipase [Rickettsiales endosymbiont of Paramecium tredecaurelia]|uniref:patatin-like phospholipase family protein n=1 Tax=Candidatus Sarmatiella mevalonica TaxID=2770581 RepID=UPI0019211A7C|nr:patatin-like phospholipase family protein [Candidatus Sarmatiella mevalonica]MBL3284539.1 Patatin-like phospholipase [Candidatus Sarmatiella mevalonica]
MKPKSEQELESLRAAQDAQIECLAFSGGGAKGAAYSGVYTSLASAGIMDNVKGVAGSSAGAISAALIATGMPHDKFTKVCQDMDFKKLLGTGKYLGKLGHKAEPLYDLLDKNIRDSIYQFLQENPPATLKAKGLAVDSVIAANNLMARCSNGDKIYFKDLALMRSIAPERFKDLVITATDKQTGELMLFNTQDTPDVEIVIAAKASSALPIVFEPVKINGKEYVDGGYRDNVPITRFSGNNSNQPKTADVERITSAEMLAKTKAQGRTLALAFGSDNKDDTLYRAIFSAKEKIYTPGKMMKFFLDVIMQKLSGIGGKTAYTTGENATYQRVRENALNTVSIDTKDVSTLSFDAAKRKAEYLHVKGYCETMSYCNNYEVGKPDPNIEMKNFLLGVYEQTTKPNSLSIENLFKERQAKAAIKHKELLSFSAPEKQWQESEMKEVLGKYIATAALDRNGLLNPNSKTMGALITLLNKPTTTNKIKEEFIKVLSIERGKDRKNLSKFQFSQSDFSEFLKNNKKLAHSGQGMSR